MALNETRSHLFLLHPDAQAPFVPEMPGNLVVPMETTGVPISCRVSDPYSHVILRSVPSGEEMPANYDKKMGFFRSLLPGQYQCETTVNGQTFRSVVYTVEAEGESRRMEREKKGAFRVDLVLCLLKKIKKFFSWDEVRIEKSSYCVFCSKKSIK